MTVAFDAIWIPIVITGLGLVWAAVMLSDTPGVVLDPMFALSVAIAWPSIPVLGAWLLWALLV